MKKDGFRLAVVFLMLAGVLAWADIDTGILCSDDLDCELNGGETYYCSPETYTCFLVEALEESQGAALEETETVQATEDLQMKSLEANVATLQTDVGSLNADIGAIRSDLAANRNDLSLIQRQFGQISSDLSSLSQQIASLRQDLAPRIDKALTGQASLQEELDSIEEGLQKEQAFTKFLKVTFFVLLGLATALIVFFYINRQKRTERKLDATTYNYVTKQIQQGKKYPQIKEGLLKSGWSEEEIKWAYQETLRTNYQRYAQKKGAAEGKETPAGNKAAEKPAAQDKTKVMLVSTVVVLMVIAALFILGGTVGKAFYVERYINQSSGELVDVVKCTPPQILSPSGGTCCTDLNNNTVCDAAERVVEEARGGECTDNLQCGYGEYCIDNRCGSLADLYQGSSVCGRRCNFYAVRISTSDKETYNGIKPGRGSYTAAGALEWKLLKDMPDHCEGEKPIVPISIIKKAPGKVLSEEVIALHRGETSRTISHPELPEVSFTLKVDDVRELCE